MSDRKMTTQKLSFLLEKLISDNYDTRNYIAKEVTFDYGKPHECRVDYMKFVPKNNSVSGIEKGMFYCYEVKSCMADYISEHGHNFIGDLNYYVMPQVLFDSVKYEIPRNIGVIVEKNGVLYVERKARAQDRKKSVQEMLLMMFRSANREVIKRKKQEGH